MSGRGTPLHHWMSIIDCLDVVDHNHSSSNHRSQYDVHLLEGYWRLMLDSGMQKALLSWLHSLGLIRSGQGSWNLLLKFIAWRAACVQTHMCVCVCVSVHNGLDSHFHRCWLYHRYRAYTTRPQTPTLQW